MRTIQRVIIVSLFLVPIVSIYSFEFESVDVHVGYGIYLNGYQLDSSGARIQGSAVDPTFISFGVGTTFEIIPWLRFAPSIDIFWNEYLMLSMHDGKVVPTGRESGGGLGAIASVLTLVVSIPWVHDFELPESFSIGIGVSPTFVFRIPVAGLGNSDISGIGDYFYSSGRFFYPEVRARVSYDFSELLEIGVGVRVLFPIHNIWDQFSAELYDEMIILPSVKIRLKL